MAAATEASPTHPLSLPDELISMLLNEQITPLPSMKPSRKPRFRIAEQKRELPV